MYSPELRLAFMNLARFLPVAPLHEVLGTPRFEGTLSIHDRSFMGFKGGMTRPH
jgi:hypothetical protein